MAGIGWERSEGTPPPPGQAPKGRVYFTYCGQRLSPILEDVAGGMWPLVHIQKKVGICWLKRPWKFYILIVVNGNGYFICIVYFIISTSLICFALNYRI